MMKPFFFFFFFLAFSTTFQTLWSADSKQAINDQNNVMQQPIQAFKLSSEGGEFAMEVGNTGVMSVHKKMIGTISGDGMLLGPDGKELARLKPDGTAVAKGDHPLGKVLLNGDIEIEPDTKFPWANGSLKFGEDGPLIKLTPDKQETRRWASFLILLSFTAVPQDP